MFNMSAAMAGEFVRVTTEMTERIAAIGASPLRANGAAVSGEEA
jgi:hypothetical protein